MRSLFLTIFLVLICSNLFAIGFAMESKGVKSIFKPTKSEYGYGFRRVGIGLFGSSSVGTNFIEYRFTPRFSTGLGLGVEDGYAPLRIDKIKASLKYCLFDTPLTPYGTIGYVLREKIAKDSNKNFAYFGVATQYLASNGLGLSLEIDFFRVNDKNNLKPGFAVYWFF